MVLHNVFWGIRKPNFSLKCEYVGANIYICVCVKYLD